MFSWENLKSAIAQFREEVSGVMTVEMVIMLPGLFWMITTSFELFEVHRYKAARLKATYTVADMLSREMLPVDSGYIDAAKQVFDDVTTDNGTNQVRFTVVHFESATNTYGVRWSEVRGQGQLTPLTTADVSNAHDELPVLQGGEELIIVESASTYQPTFEYPGLNNSYTVSTRIFTSVRFVSQLCWASGSACG